MPDPIRHPLTPVQQKQIATLQAALTHQQNLANAYVQAIADGLDAPEGSRWRIEGTDLVGEVSGPTLVKE